MYVLSSALLEAILSTAPLMLACTLPSTLSGLAHLHVYLPSLILLGFISLRCVDLLTWCLLGMLSITDGTAYLAHLLLILTAFAILECTSTAFRSLSLGLRFSCNGLAGHVLLHLGEAATLPTPTSRAITTYLIAGYSLYELAVTAIQLAVFSMLYTTYM